MARIRFRWHETISDFLEGVFRRAFPGEPLPGEIEYDLTPYPACDACLFGAYCSFELPDGKAEISFTFNTGEGGLRCVDSPVPPPSFSDVLVTVDGDEGMRAWDPETGGWRYEWEED